MSSDSLLVAQRYFDAWNRHDAEAIVATFADGGTYADPKTAGPLTGDAIGAYARNVWAGFPDLAFEVVSTAENAEGLVSAEWRMTGTNTAPFSGLPPSGRGIALPGADFIRVEGDRIRSVQGYFDGEAVPRALGLEVTVQPRAMGPFGFGTSVRASNGSTAAPGVFSITFVEARGEQEKQEILERSRKIATEMLSMPGFISFVGATVGERMMTITAWETEDAVGQLRAGGEHRAAMTRFFGDGVGGGASTGVWVPGRLNPRRVRCEACDKAVPADVGGTCPCGATLPAPPPYW